MTVPARLPRSKIVAREDSLLSRRLVPVVRTFAPTTRTGPVRLWFGALLVAVVLGWRLLGPIGGAGGGLLCLLVPVLGPRLVAAKERSLDEARLAERAAGLARALRSGRPMVEAIESAAADELPTARRWRTIADQVRLGRPLDETLGEAATAVDVDERMVLVGLRLGLTEGGAVAASTAVMASRIRHERELVARRRVLTTQARTSAWVLAALPLVFGAALVAMRGPEAWLRPFGLVSVTVGLGLELVGVLWMRRMVRRIR